jgi:anti-anti-sigma regulatory factor
VYIDTSALAVFLETLGEARKLKRTFHLSGLGRRPRDLLEATGLIRLFSECRTKHLHEFFTTRKARGR